MHLDCEAASSTTIAKGLNRLQSKLNTDATTATTKIHSLRFEKARKGRLWSRPDEHIQKRQHPCPKPWNRDAGGRTGAVAGQKQRANGRARRGGTCMIEVHAWNFSNKRGLSRMQQLDLIPTFLCMELWGEQSIIISKQMRRHLTNPALQTPRYLRGRTLNPQFYKKKSRLQPYQILARHPRRRLQNTTISSRQRHAETKVHPCRRPSRYNSTVL